MVLRPVIKPINTLETLFNNDHSVTDNEKGRINKILLILKLPSCIHCKITGGVSIQQHSGSEVSNNLTMSQIFVNISSQSSNGVRLKC